MAVAVRFRPLVAEQEAIVRLLDAHNVAKVPPSETEDAEGLADRGVMVRAGWQDADGDVRLGGNVDEVAELLATMSGWGAAGG